MWRGWYATARTRDITNEWRSNLCSRRDSLSKFTIYPGNSTLLRPFEGAGGRNNCIVVAYSTDTHRTTNLCKGENEPFGPCIDSYSMCIRMIDMCKLQRHCVFERRCKTRQQLSQQRSERHNSPIYFSLFFLTHSPLLIAKNFQRAIQIFTASNSIPR